MEKELIKTHNYLLVVDDSSINYDDWVYDEVDALFFQYGVEHKKLNPSAKKVIAHLPFGMYSTLEGVPLLPPFSRHQEDGLEELVKEHFELNKELNNPSSFKAGYNKAKEKCDEVLKWIDEEIILNSYYKDSPRLKEGASMVKVKIQSLSQPKTPTYFEFEMESMTIDEIREQGKGFLHAPTFKIKTTTNSQGQQVACGKYIY